MPPDVSVVVVSYRPGDWLAPCVASVLAQADEVVVVDNGSEGALASAVASSMGAQVVRSTANLGFSGGVDLGLRRAQGQVVGLLNDDAVAGPNWIESARGVLADPAVAAVTPKVVLDGLFGEVLLDDEPWLAPGDARPLGRQLRSVTVGGRRRPGGRARRGRLRHRVRRPRRHTVPMAMDLGAPALLRPARRRDGGGQRSRSTVSPSSCARRAVCSITPAPTSSTTGWPANTA